MERCSSAIGGHPGKTRWKRKPLQRAQWQKGWEVYLENDCCDTSNWKCWIARWECDRIVSGLHLRNMGTRVSSFLHAMGREAEDVFTNRRQRPIFLHLTNTTSEKAIQTSQASG
uniref:Putative conserved protein with signal anchor n=1 Tax=Ixodes ricinus TaxID=34613 RepID=A0A147BLR0_IXORI